MQNFATVICKHTSIPLALQTFNDALKKLAADPNTSHLVIHSFQICPAVEMPDKQAGIIPINGNVNQPQMFIYAVALLVAPDSAAIGSPSKIASKQMNPLPLSADDLAEIEKIKKATRSLCKHDHLQPEKLYKGYRGPDHWYQVCADCGAEVWNSQLQGYNMKTENGRMVHYENNPATCNHENLEPIKLIRKDKGGHYGVYKGCRDCGEEIYQGVPTGDQLAQLVDAQNKGLDLLQVPIDPIGDQVNDQLTEQGRKYFNLPTDL